MSTKRKKSMRRLGDRTVKDPTPLSPLSWWRHMQADLFTADIAAFLRQHVAVFAILGEPTWAAAVAGDAACAVGLALRLDQHAAAPAISDLIMTVVLACAVDGDPAACLAMSYVLRRRPGAGWSEHRLATGWLVRNLATVMKRNKHGSRR